MQQYLQVYKHKLCVQNKKLIKIDYRDKASIKTQARSTKTALHKKPAETKTFSFKQGFQYLLSNLDYIPTFSSI